MQRGNELIGIEYATVPDYLMDCGQVADALQRVGIDNDQIGQPARGNSTDVVGQIHRGRTMGTSEGDLKDKAGKLYAHATTTCMIFPKS